MSKKNISIASPVTGIDEWNAVQEPIESGWLTQGPKVSEFEKNFAKHHNVSNALAVTSCTAGLHLALAALGIGPGDEVIVPAFTWVATANVVLHCGATPIFVDVRRDTFNIDPAKITSKITKRTRAIIPVHLFGLCADIDQIKAVIPNHVKIIEDAACAAGAMYKSQYAGTLGDVAAFSFHPRKTITTGEGGMITTNNTTLSERMNQMRNHGASISEEQRHLGAQPYLLPEFNLLGFNYRMTDLQGAIGIVQLTKLDAFIDERKYWANYYHQALQDIPWLKLPSEPIEGRHGWQSFVTYVDVNTAPLTRNALMSQLQEMGIATRPGTHAVHMLSFYKEKYDLTPDDYPAAKDCNDNSMAIPLHNKMQKDDFDYIIKALHLF